MSLCRHLATIGMAVVCTLPTTGGATAQTAKAQEMQSANNFLRLIAQGNEVRFSLYNQDGDLARDMVTVTWATQNGCSTAFDGVFGEGAPARRNIDWTGVSEITLGDILSRDEAPDGLRDNLNGQTVEVGPGGVTDANGRSQSVVFRFVGALAPHVYKVMKSLQADCASAVAPR